MAPLTVLVLGVGGNVSQGIMKALAHSSLELRMLAGCVDPLSPGLYFAQSSFVTPYASDPEFIPWVEEVCEREGVDAVLSGVEPVLDALSPHAERLRERTGALCVVSPPKALAVGADKLETAGWLEQHDLAYPRSADAADPDAVRGLLNQTGLPLVAKPRRGRGGHGVRLVESQPELALVAGTPGLILQEHLAGDEYTVGVVCDGQGEPRASMAMRRVLEGATTVRAYAGDFPELRSYAESIASELRPVGPLNAQLRVAAGRPVAFELNVRFSGTTPVRTRLGFNEVEATLRHLLYQEPVSLPLVTEGTMVRYWNEVYPAPDSVATLTEQGRLDPSGSAVVEDWGMEA